MNGFGLLLVVVLVAALVWTSRGWRRASVQRDTWAERSHRQGRALLERVIGGGRRTA